LRRFGVERRSLADFAPADVADALTEIMRSRCNALISGATSSGKTSLLNALTAHVGATERIVTLEDTAELRLDAGHVVRLETRSATIDGTPAVTMADLVRTSLRLRPDRIVVGEIRGAEVVDMLNAMNTGHDGSLGTCHANSPLDAVRRLEALIAQHAPGWPADAVRDTIRSSLDVIVHVERLPSGRRHVAEIIELGAPGSDDAHVRLVAAGTVTGRLSRGRA
jgi:pilus assembly protein CpaF